MQKKYLSFLLSLSLLPVCLEVDLSVPGFPEMALTLGIQEKLLQQSVAWNFLGFFIGALIYGPCSEHFGRRFTLLTGFFIMTLGAWGCVLTQSIYAFSYARFIQGLGAGAPAVLVFTIISDSFSLKQTERLIGFMNAFLTLCMAGAPGLGCLLVRLYGWKSTYWLLALLSGSVFILLVFYLPESLKTKKKFSFYSFKQDFLKLLRSPDFMIAAITPSLLFTFYMGFVVTAPLLYCHIFNTSLFSYGLYQSFFLGVFAFVSLLSSKITTYFGKKETLIFSNTLIMAGSLSLVVTGIFFPESPFLTTASMSFYSIGFALAYPLLFSRSLSLFPVLKGLSTSLIMSLRMLISAFSLFCLSNAYQHSLLSLAFALLPLALLFMSGIILLHHKKLKSC
tara:strand:- start:337 stop:1515 length:1179 start_codon:yes stop_codon:yes gene_type:complete